jgi:hypothetical protein
MMASWSTAVSRLCSGKQGEGQSHEGSRQSEERDMGEDDEVSESEDTNSRKWHTQKQGSRYRHPPLDTYTAYS